MAQKLAWDSWTVEDGLSNNEVTAIHQDQFGWIWIATGHGLTSYNSYEFEVYRYHPFDSNSMGANYVEALYETGKGDIWAALSVGGLSQLNRASRTFQSYQSSYLSDADLRAANIFVRTLLEDDQGDIWVGTSAGLNRVHAETSTYQRVWPNQKLKHKRVNCLHQAKRGELLLGTDQGLVVYNIATGQVTSPRIAWQDTTLNNHYPIHQIVEDSNGEIWLGSFEGGVFRWDGASDLVAPQWNRVDSTLAAPRKCIRLFSIRDEIWATFQNHGLMRMDATEVSDEARSPTSSLRWALAMNQGVAWGLSEEGDVVQIDKRTGQIGKEEAQELDFDWRTVCLADDGALWFARNTGGIGRAHLHTPIIEGFELEAGEETPQNVRAMLTDSEGGFWLANHEGIIRKPPAGQPLQRWYFDSQQIPGNLVLGMAEDLNKQIWVATNNGLACLSWNKPEIKRYLSNRKHPNALNTNFIRGVNTDQQGRLWVGTSAGLHLYRPATDDFRRFCKQDHPNSLNGNDVRIVLEADTNVYWVGKIRTGLNRMTYFPAQDSISCEPFYFAGNHHFSDSLMTINSLLLDREGQLWIGTFSDGLLRFDEQQQAIVPVFEHQAPIPGITAIQEDQRGSLWMGSNTGLYRYDPCTSLLQQFLVSDGVQSPQFHIGSFAKDRKGRLFFGGTKGVNFVEPSTKYQPGLGSSPQITGIQKYGENMGFHVPVQHLEQLKLNAKDAFFSLHFLAIDFQSPQPLQYRYRLEGLHENWIELGHQRSVSFSHLPGGEYVFSVSVGDRQGNWSKGEAVLPIVVAFPFHQTPAFYGLILLISLLIAWAIYALRWYFQRRKMVSMARIREKAAADFHDELGHRLTKISLFAERIFLQNPKLEGESHQYLQKVSQNAAELYHSMRDFLWAMNPKKDALLEFAIHLKDFGDELYSHTSIVFQVEGIESLPPDVMLSMDWKRQLVLIFKEGMHNSLKHANCTHVQLSFNWEENILQVVLVDNGQGFVWSPKHMGYGLRNMQERAERIDGQLMIKSHPSVGTEVSFKGYIQTQSIWLKKKAFR